MDAGAMVNVIARNPEFGFQVTEAVAAIPGVSNSRENRLTALVNDIVSDPPGDRLPA